MKSSVAGSEMLARLHTACSSGEEYSTISQHRLEDLMVPRFCWFDLRLHASLKRMYGVPVSVCDSSTLCHSSRAGTVRSPRPRASQSR